jgi:hypothetical protein
VPAILSLLFTKAGIVGMIAVGLLALFGIQELRLQHAKSDLTTLRKADAAALAEANARSKAASAISTASQVQSTAEKVQIVTRYKVLEGKVKELPVIGDCRAPDSWIQIWNAGT